MSVQLCSDLYFDVLYSLSFQLFAGEIAKQHREGKDSLSRNSGLDKLSLFSPLAPAIWGTKCFFRAGIVGLWPRPTNMCLWAAGHFLSHSLHEGALKMHPDGPHGANLGQ
jgi:hypothetical protein